VSALSYEIFPSQVDMRGSAESHSKAQIGKLEHLGSIGPRPSLLWIVGDTSIAQTGSHKFIHSMTLYLIKEHNHY